MPTYVDSDIDRIKTLIKDKGMKQKHVCAQLGLSETYLSNIKNGKDKMTCERLKKIVEMLGTTTDYLTGHTDDPSPIEPKPPKAELSEDQQELLQRLLSLSGDEQKKAFDMLKLYLDK